MRPRLQRAWCAAPCACLTVSDPALTSAIPVRAWQGGLPVLSETSHAPRPCPPQHTFFDKVEKSSASLSAEMVALQMQLSQKLEALEASDGEQAQERRADGVEVVDGT